VQTRGALRAWRIVCWRNSKKKGLIPFCAREGWKRVLLIGRAAASQSDLPVRCGRLGPDGGFLCIKPQDAIQAILPGATGGIF